MELVQQVNLQYANFLCFQIDNYFNDKRINFDNLFKKIKNKYGETDKIYNYEPVKYMINDAIKTNKNILFDHIVVLWYR